MFHNRAREFTFLRRFDHKSTFFKISRNLIRKEMILEPNFKKITKTVKTSTAKPVNLSETSRDTADVHQRTADSLQSL